jgi:glycolate oxidase iron-sulfur subunit
MIFPEPLSQRLSSSLNNAEQCTHCGYCLPVCPTYRLHRDETESPRGRVSILLAVQAGHLAPEQASDRLAHCLLCRACHASCPAGVRPGKLVGLARGLSAPVPTPWPVRLMHWITHRPRLTAWAAAVIGLYRRSRWHTIRHTRATQPRPVPDHGRPGAWLTHMALVEHLLPALPDQVDDDVHVTFPAVAVPPAARNVLLLPGCIGRMVLPHLAGRTERLATALGYRVRRVDAFGCCGAPLREHGERAAFLRQARQVLDQIARVMPLEQVDTLLCDSAICVVTLRSYGRALEKDPHYAAPALACSQKVRGVDEFMAAHAGQAPWTHGNPHLGTLAFHDHCQSRNSLHVVRPARQLLRSLAAPWVELPQAGQCCGAGGDYMLRFPATSEAIGRDRWQAVQASGADTVISCNPGCIMQLQSMHRAGVTSPPDGPGACHFIDVLWAAARDRARHPSNFSNSSNSGVQEKANRHDR